MNEKFNKNAKVEQLNKMFLSREEENGLIVKDPFTCVQKYVRWSSYVLTFLSQRPFLCPWIEWSGAY